MAHRRGCNPKCAGLLVSRSFAGRTMIDEKKDGSRPAHSKCSAPITSADARHGLGCKMCTTRSPMHARWCSAPNTQGCCCMHVTLGDMGRGRACDHAGCTGAWRSRAPGSHGVHLRQVPCSQCAAIGLAVGIAKRARSNSLSNRYTSDQRLKRSSHYLAISPITEPWA